MAVGWPQDTSPDLALLNDIISNLQHMGQRHEYQLRKLAGEKRRAQHAFWTLFAANIALAMAGLLINVL